MQKLSFLFLFLTFFYIIIYCNSSNEVKLKTEFIPNSSYNMSTQIESDSEVDFTASEEIIKALKDGGMKIPMKVSSSQRFKQYIETGNLDSNGNFPMKMEIKDVFQENIVNGVKTELPSQKGLIGLRIDCKYTKENTLSDIEIIGENISDDIKKALPSVMENMLKNIKYPDEPISIGESFKQEIPMQIPIVGGVAVNIKLVVNYTLTKVETNKAYFDTNTEMLLTQNSDEYSINANGGGGGILIHDVSKNFAIENNSDLIMNFSIETKDLKIISKSSSKTVFRVE